MDARKNLELRQIKSYLDSKRANKMNKKILEKHLSKQKEILAGRRRYKTTTSLDFSVMYNEFGDIASIVPIEKEDLE